jgi:hypothetical protein
VGDSSVENNEQFFILLSDAAGARLVKGEATGIIDDEDQAADLSVAPLFTGDGFSLDESVRVSNAGPRAATDIALRVTSTPDYGGTRCSTCSIPQLAVGEAKTTAYEYWPPFEQIYLSAIATARQGDPQTSNNSASWTVNYYRMMAMNAAYLTTGATATVTAVSLIPTAAATSSDPSVVAISSAVNKLNDDIVTFTVTALKPGTSELRLDGHQKTLLATVVAPGLTPRWPGGVVMSTDFTATRFDHPVTVTVTPAGVAPLTAATATGTIVVTAAGQELTRRAISGATELKFPLYLPSLGPNNLQITYSGDANFLPQTIDQSVFVRQGVMSMTGTLVRATDTVGTYTLAIEAAGSPAAAPTGIVSVVNGTTELTRMTLQPAGGGTSRAEVTLTNLPKYSTLTLNYLGDALYLSGSQQIRAADSRRRSASH